MDAAFEAFLTGDLSSLSKLRKRAFKQVSVVALGSSVAPAAAPAVST
jgi:hypothetical protein